jgi:cell division cycle 14
MKAGWYNYSSFNAQKFDSLLRKGDLSWIVPGKIIAFPSPVSQGYGKSSSASVGPRELIDPFYAAKVGGVIRLNDLLYDKKPLERENIKVHGLEFPDGSNPSD